MKLKRGVNREAVHPAIWFALGVADEVYRQVAGKGCVVASLNDSHADRPKSLHNRGRAADLRTRDVTLPKVSEIHRQLVVRLDPRGFDVVLEPDHIHIEYDPKQGEAWLQEGAA